MKRLFTFLGKDENSLLKMAVICGGGATKRNGENFNNSWNLIEILSNYIIPHTRYLYLIPHYPLRFFLFLIHDWLFHFYTNSYMAL